MGTIPAVAPAASVAPTFFADFVTRSRRALVSHDVVVRKPESFRGYIHSADLGTVQSVKVRSARHAVRRTDHHIANSDSSFVKVILQLWGPARLHQSGQTIDLAAGDIIAYDTALAYQLDYPAPYAALMLLMPRDRLVLPAGSHGSLSAHRFERRGAASCLGSFLREVGHNFDLDPMAARSLGDAAIELVASLLRSELLARPQDPWPQNQLHAQLLAWIDDHVCDPELSPTSIALAHHISVSRLHAVFRSAGESVSQHIRSERLIRAQRLLRDPLFFSTSVTSIGRQVGFTDPAHFSRVYRNRFGLPPSAERRDARAERQQ